jgi:hypothetical protein
MKFAIVTLLAMTSSVTTVVIAQDGNGHGPPMAPIIIMPRAPVPTIPSPTGGVKKFFQRTSELASMTK